MQPVQLQKDKLDLIEWIVQLDDEEILLQLKEIMVNAESSGFTLTDEQKLMVEESAAKYDSGEEPGYTWEEVLQNADRYVLSDEQKAEVRESHQKYLSGEDRGYTWEEVKERARKKLDEKKS